MKKLLIILSVLFFTSTLSISQTWIQSLNGRNVWSIAKDPQGNIYAGGLTGTHSRIWKSTNGGTTWDTIFIGAGQTMWDFAFDSQGNIYVANFSNGLLKSTNNGVNFSVTPISFFNNKNLQGVECGSDGYIFVTSSSGFFISMDNGQTFSETALTGLNCLPVMVDKDSANIVYVGVSSGTGAGIGFYRSTNFGLTFSENLNPGKNGYNIFQGINGNIYMITTTSPYNLDISTNKGLTWTTLSNLPQAQRGIARGITSGANYIYTSGNGGVFRSTDNGLTFTNYNFSNSATPILYIEYNAVLKIFAGTSGASSGGVWMLEAIIQNIVNDNENAGDYVLLQNYPNPFNPGTVINYTIRNTEFIVLRIYDALGNEVKTLVNKKQTQGSYSVEWNSADSPGGVYFYKLTSDNFSISKKMILLK